LSALIPSLPLDRYEEAKERERARADASAAAAGSSIVSVTGPAPADGAVPSLVKGSSDPSAVRDWSAERKAEAADVSDRYEMLFILFNALLDVCVADTKAAFTQLKADKEKEAKEPKGDPSLAASRTASSMAAPDGTPELGVLSSTASTAPAPAEAKGDKSKTEDSADKPIATPASAKSSSGPFQSFLVLLQSHLFARISRLWQERSQKISAHSADSSSMALRSLLHSIVIHTTAGVGFLRRYVALMLGAVNTVEDIAKAFPKQGTVLTAALIFTTRRLTDFLSIVWCLSDLLCVAGVLRKSFVCFAFPPLVIGMAILPQPLPPALSAALFRSLYTLLLTHDKAFLLPLVALEKEGEAKDKKDDEERDARERVEREKNKEKLAAEKVRTPPLPPLLTPRVWH
jgi:hypothetical protein